jgi:hypothetical protein
VEREFVADLSSDQAEALLEAAIRNTQIQWILGDDDVYEFFTAIARRHEDSIDPAMLAEFWDLFEEE